MAKIISFIRPLYKLACYKWLFLILLSIILTTILYSINNTFFYKSQRNQSAGYSERRLRSLEHFVNAVSEKQNQNQHVLNYINTIRGNITVTKSLNTDEIIWQVDGRGYVDERRKRFINSAEFQDSQGFVYNVQHTVYIEPPFFSHLLNAWSFSTIELLKNPYTYSRNRLWMRSVPLYAYLVVVIGSMFVLKFRDALMLREWDQQLLENEQAKERLKIDADELRKKLNDSEQNRQEAEQLFQLTDTEKKEIENKLQQREIKIRRLENKQSEISDNINNHSYIAEKNYRELLRLTKQMLRSSRHCDIHIGNHGINSVVDSAVKKLPKDFMNDYFVRLHDAEYDPKGTESIRIKDLASQTSRNNVGPNGALRIVLKHDAGPAIDLEYSAKSNPASLGAVLAMLLKVRCKEFRDFDIR